jgi:hypothetical protein
MPSLSIPLWILGLISLVLGLFFTFIAPTGRRATFALLDEAAVFGAFVFAAYCLWPVSGNNDWSWILPGIMAGIIAILIIEFRRFTRYFHNLQYRVRHPYFWYGKISSWTRRRRRS